MKRMHGKWIHVENTIEWWHETMQYVPEKTTWLNENIEYLFNEDIFEIDIADAGLSIIKEFRLLPQEKIDTLSRLDKKERHIAVGCMQRDDGAFSSSLLNKFIEIRRIFLQTNDLQDSEIISVKKDAFFVTRKCHKLKFGKIQFANKNQYSSYIRFVKNKNLEVYYNENKTDIKGMGELAINRHRIYWIYYLRQYISKMEQHDLSVKRWMKRLISDYKKKKLDDAFYVEFNNQSSAYNPVFNWNQLIVPLVQIMLKEIH